MAHILIVDDDPAMLAFLSKALTQEGYQTTSAEDGLDALNKLRIESDIDLLLTDIVMPGIDGIELSKKARELYPDLKVMFMTGFSASAAGDEQMLSKPFHLKDLIKQIHNSLNQA